MAYGFGTYHAEQAATASLPLITPDEPFDWGQAGKNVGAVAGIAAGKVIGGFLQRGAYKQQARWARIAAEQEVANYYAAANRAGAQASSALFASGFQGGGGLADILSAERGAAEADAVLTRFNAEVTASALEKQGRFAAVGGVIGAIGDVAKFAAGGA